MISLAILAPLFGFLETGSCEQGIKAGIATYSVYINAV